LYNTDYYGASTVAEYDAFISYSRADSQHAADIDSALRQKGLRTFFDRRDMGPGLPWVRAVEAAIGAAKAAVILVGPSGLGNTQQYERELAFARQTHEPTFPVVPVLLPNTRDPPFNFLRVVTWVDFSQATKVWDAPNELQRLLTAVQPRPEDVERARADICPYRGLDAFREEDSAFFFGRGSADDAGSPIGQLIGKVRDHHFVMVVGRSGSGKSSLVYAGLVPALRRETNRFWNVLSLRPGPEPLRALAAAFNPRTEHEGAAAYVEKISQEAERLRTGKLDLLSHMIREYLKQAEGEPDRLLLYVDQWEELYSQGPSPDAAGRSAGRAADVNRFIDLLLDAARSAPATVVGTVRADFYDPLISHVDIRSLLPNQQVLVASMTRAELESTIVEPAKMVGLEFDPPTLVETILDDAGQDEGMLPMLQYALKETWNEREKNPRTGEKNRLTGGSYARSGGVRAAIRNTAERTFKDLSQEDQQAARQLFLRLVTPGEGQEDTRARVTMPAETEQARIIEQFAGPRTRLLVTGFDRAKRPVVEVAHEALIRTWPRLRDWIDANRDKLRDRTAVLQAKAVWEAHERSEDLLLPPGFQLERARALLAQPGDITISDLEEFVAASIDRDLKQIALKQETERRLKEAELEAARRARETAEKERELAAQRAAAAEADRAAKEKQLRYQRLASFGAAVAALVLMLLAVLAWEQRQTALQKTKEAEQELTAAVSYVQKLVAGVSKYLESGAVSTFAARQLLVPAEEALHDLEGIHTTPEVVREQIRLLLTVSDAYVHLADTENAQRRAEQAKRMLSDLIVEQPDNSELKRLLYGSCFRIGDALDKKGHLREAQQEYDTALKLAEELAGQAQPDSDRQFDLLFIHDKVGDILKRQADLSTAPANLWAGALVHYKRARAVEEQLLQRDNSNPLWQARLSATLTRIGQVLASQQEFREALDVYQRAAAISRKLADDELSNKGRQHTLAVGYSRIGTTLLSLKKPAEARKYFDDALAIRKHLVDEDEKSARFRDVLASSYANMGDVEAISEKWDDAANNYQKAIDILQDLWSKDSTDLERKSRLDAVKKKLEAVLPKRAKASNTSLELEKRN
jgi:tetratricopeptide (TPR) repeat protein